MASSFVLKVIIPIGGLIYVENFFLRTIFESIYTSSSIIPFIPKAFAGVIVVNIVGSSILLITLGLKVGLSRSKFKEKALKDGDTDAEARYSYPKMYAEGFSENAKKFNCIQRGINALYKDYNNLIIHIIKVISMHWKVILNLSLYH